MGILNYPAAWMLPFATFFVIGPTKSPCCSKTDDQTHHLGVSKPYTIINIILTYVIYVTIFSASVTDVPSLWILSSEIGFTAFHAPLLICIVFHGTFLCWDNY